MPANCGTRGYQAVPITTDFQAKTVIAYVHANPGEEIGYRWTGHSKYLDPHAAQRPGAWFDAKAGLEIYGSLSNYRAWFERAVEARKRKNDK